MEETLSIVRLCTALAFMTAASVMDWRTRRVPNRVWIILGTIGIALLAAQMLLSKAPETAYEAWHFLVFIPICIIFYDTFWDREPVYWEGKVNPAPIALYLIALIASLVMIKMEGLTATEGGLLAVPIIMVVFTVFYYLGIVRGGADAKALMALALVFPFYTTIAGLPLIPYPEHVIDTIQVTFPFSFLILMYAAIFHVAAGPIIRFARNLARKDYGFPEMFLGYRMDIDQVPKKFVWPMEAVRDDEIVLILFPSRNADQKEELAKLKAKGLARIWVTPKDPFIIPMTAGIAAAAVIGNIIILLFPL